jgi:KDO2-lipid IV(A) lauroyltransferase
MALLLRWLSRLPLSLLYLLGRLARPLVQHVARYRRATVRANLERAFPELTTAERRHIERDFYGHLCDLAAEVIAAPRLSLAELQRRVRFENAELLRPYIEQQQSLLLLTCHQGNWEWLLYAMSQQLPCPIDAVYKPLHSRAMDEFMHATRSRLGRPIAFHEAGREILRRRRDYRAFAMVADQAPFKKDKRYWSTFFGQPASFYLGPQKIAEATQSPVLFIQMQREGRGHYRVRITELGQPPYPKGSFDLLQRYVEAIEAAVRAEPATWLWSNRKWKHRQPADAAVNATQ